MAYDLYLANFTSAGYIASDYEKKPFASAKAQTGRTQRGSLDHHRKRPGRNMFNEKQSAQYGKYRSNEFSHSLANR
jgi:hypothetical protein